MTTLSKRHFIILGTIVTAIGLIAAYPAFRNQKATGNEPQKEKTGKEQTAKQKVKGIPGSYIEPVQPDKETQSVLENIGVNSMAFEYFAPKDYKVIVKILSLENDKKIVKSISRVFLDGASSASGRAGVFRLIRTDPRKMRQNDRGKIRWTFSIDGFSNADLWLKDRYTATGSRQSWIQAKEVKNLELGKDYLVWKILAYPKDLKGLYPNSPTTFRMEVRVRIEKAGMDSWKHSSSDYEDYIEREKKKAAEKARRDKDSRAGHAPRA